MALSHRELGELDNLVGGEVNLDSVVGLDEGVGEADGPAIVGHDVGDTLIPGGESLDAAQLVGSLLGLRSRGNRHHRYIVLPRHIKTLCVQG